MKYIAIIAALITALGCSTIANIDRTWVDKDIHSKNLSGVLVVAMAENAELRKLFEDDYVTELKKHGVNAHASHKLGLKRINPDNVVAVAYKAVVAEVKVAHKGLHLIWDILTVEVPTEEPKAEPSGPKPSASKPRILMV